jgi:hypothetical protein
MIILAVGLTALGLALVLLAVFLKRGEQNRPEKGRQTETAEPEPSPNAFIDEPLETDMSAVLLGSAPFSATGTSPAVDLTVDREHSREREQAEMVEEAPTMLEWEEAIPASLFETETPSPEETGPASAGPPETIDLDIPGELEVAPITRAVVRVGPGRDGIDYSWQLRRDAPVLGAAAGIAVAASLIGYAVGRRRRKSRQG